MKMKKKMIGAIVCGGVLLLYFGVILTLVFLAVLFQEEIPLPFAFFLLILLSIPFLGILISLISRIREIKSGEEEEAKKY